MKNWSFLREIDENYDFNIKVIQIIKNAGKLLLNRDFNIYEKGKNNYYTDTDLQGDNLEVFKYNDVVVNHRYPNKNYYTLTKKYNGRKLSKIGYPVYLDRIKNPIKRMISLDINIGYKTLNFIVDTYFTKSKPFAMIDIIYCVKDKSVFINAFNEKVYATRNSLLINEKTRTNIIYLDDVLERDDGFVFYREIIEPKTYDNKGHIFVIEH